ncbi:TonB family protein [Campylobacter hyointestinalis]|uniref:TonB family protein n=1 Tax=Campylobacter hyointestinalis TaxID=198 RepID=UPI000DCCB020|nr:TonB family protein [Campylobacter hyointestinalis]RAZ24709.1 energy transducer TonB [Campylobacter hyointestinalis subsp. lawsonii]RAZ38967.1 energy transducer TonB [Campylobacter hyointestinalis subsp. lawsonii]
MRISPSSQKTISINLLAFLISAVLHVCVFAYALNLDIKTPKEQTKHSLKLSLNKFEALNDNVKSDEKVKKPKTISEMVKKLEEPKQEHNPKTPKKPIPKKVEKKQTPKENISNKADNATQKTASDQNAIDVNTTSSALLQDERTTTTGDISKPIYLKSDDELFIKIKNEIVKNVTYPRTARKLGQQGVVKVEFVLDKNGLKSYGLKKQSHFSSLNAAALKALKNASSSFPKVDSEYQISLDIAFELK